MKAEYLNQFVDMLQEKVNDYFLKNYRESFLKGIFNEKVVAIEGKKYYRINIGSSGKFMYDTQDNHVYYIKGYGVIDRKKDFGEIEAIVNANFDYDSYSIVPFNSKKRSSYGYAGKLTNNQ